jgi:hypothetical protein
LNPLNIEARYPEYKYEIASGLTKENCEEYIERFFTFIPLYEIILYLLLKIAEILVVFQGKICYTVLVRLVI